VHLVNDSDLFLATGDMSIFDHGRFVGQFTFTPMLMGDDQIVNYGLSSSVNVTRVQPNINKSKAKDEVVDVEFVRDGDGKKFGINIWYKSVLKTKYKLENNGETAVQRLYVDHSAYSHNNGYTITTEEHAVKSVTGFKRFEFALAIDEDREFEVCEEAVYCSRVTDTSSLENFATKTLPSLLSGGTIKGDLASELEAVISWRRLKEAVIKIRDGSWLPSSLAVVKHLFTKEYLRVIVQDCEKMNGLSSQVEDQKRFLNGRKVVITNIKDVQERLRENIKGLEKVSGSKSVEALLSRYLKDLNAQEDELVKCNKQIDSAEEQVYRLTQMMDALRAGIQTSCRKALATINASQ
jgi:hypothetical protein